MAAAKSFHYTLNDLRCDPFSMTHVCMGCRLTCKKMSLSKTIDLAGWVSSFWSRPPLRGRRSPNLPTIHQHIYARSHIISHVFFLVAFTLCLLNSDKQSWFSLHAFILSSTVNCVGCVGCVGFLVESTADYVWASWYPTGILCYVQFVAILD